MKKTLLPVILTNVFAADPSGGNPCPVVFNGEHLSDSQMRAIAARYEGEVVFVLKSSDPLADVRLRYFVPNHEMEMCVHATIGATSVLYGKGLWSQPQICYETALGVITVRQEGKRFEVEQFPPVFEERAPSPLVVASALGVEQSEFDLGRGPIQAVSTSRPKLMVPLRSRAVLDSLRPDYETLWALCDTYGTTGIYPFAIESHGDESVVYARQFPKRSGFLEDPATGVAATALEAYLVKYANTAVIQPGWHQSEVRQGEAMGKASVLYPKCLIVDGSFVETRISGHAEIVGEEIVIAGD